MNFVPTVKPYSPKERMPAEHHLRVIVIAYRCRIVCFLVLISNTDKTLMIISVHPGVFPFISPFVSKVCVSLSPLFFWLKGGKDSTGADQLDGQILFHARYTHRDTRAHTHRHPFFSCNRLIGLRPRVAWGRRRREGRG